MTYVLASSAAAVLWAVALLMSDVRSRRRRIGLEMPCNSYEAEGSTRMRYDLGPVVHGGRVLRGSLYGPKRGISVGQSVAVDLDPRRPGRVYPRGRMPLFPHWPAAAVYGGAGLATGLGALFAGS